MKKSTTDSRLASVRDSLPAMKELYVDAAAHLGFPEDTVTAVCGCAALNMLGFHTHLIAGSAKWLLMTDEEQGDAMLTGIKPVGYYGYEYHTTEALPLFVKGRMPEMHAWAVGVETEIVYDFTGPSQMKQFEELDNSHKWPLSRRLPSVIWGEYEELATRGWFYTEDTTATEFLGKLIGLLSMTTINLALKGARP